MTKCDTFNELIVWNNKKLCFRMTRQASGSWTTVYGPGWHSTSKKRPRRPKTGKFASLMRKHKKWLGR